MFNSVEQRLKTVYLGGDELLVLLKKVNSCILFNKINISGHISKSINPGEKSTIIIFFDNQDPSVIFTFIFTSTHHTLCDR